MPLLRAIVIAALILGLILGFWAGYSWSPSLVASESIPVTGYSVTPHVLKYYELSRVNHQGPPPSQYERGVAGIDYCLNLAVWYMSIQRDITEGYDRQGIAAAYRAQFDYEVAHDWLTPRDSNRLSTYILEAPAGEKAKDIGNDGKDQILGRAIYDICVKERNPPV